MAHYSVTDKEKVDRYLWELSAAVRLMAWRSERYSEMGAVLADLLEALGEQEVAWPRANERSIRSEEHAALLEKARSYIRQLDGSSNGEPG